MLGNDGRAQRKVVDRNRILKWHRGAALNAPCFIAGFTKRAMRVRPGNVNSLRSFAERCEVHKMGKCFASAQEPNMRGCCQQRHTEEAAATKETSSQSRIEASSGRGRKRKQARQTGRKGKRIRGHMKKR